mmetsp:Transcript_6215/g.14289  ORF Transcript_6215/g.14289 Transcript_6215/m.14289 type:complete len:221 (+) Transcript_6215:343-1005(+)
MKQPSVVENCVASSEFREDGFTCFRVGEGGGCFVNHVGARKEGSPANRSKLGLRIIRARVSKFLVGGPAFKATLVPRLLLGSDDESRADLRPFKARQEKCDDVRGQRGVPKEVVVVRVHGLLSRPGVRHEATHVAGHHGVDLSAMGAFAVVEGVARGGASLAQHRPDAPVTLKTDPCFCPATFGAQQRLCQGRSVAQLIPPRLPRRKFAKSKIAPCVARC